MCPIVVSAAPLSVRDTTPTNYVWDTLAKGKAVYVDRSYVYTEVPSAYAGFNVLHTANDHKSASGANLLSFDVDQAVTVYVAHDVRIQNKPDWLATWTDTGENLVSNDATLHLFQKAFPAGTVRLGANGGASSSSMYTVLLAAGPDITPRGQKQISTQMNTEVSINVLGNDQQGTVKIFSQPVHGQASVNANGMITYIPSNNFAGSDTVNYELTEPDGTKTLASVVVTVTCAQCAAGTTLGLSWDPNPESDKVLGYRVYRGNTADDANTQVADLATSAASFNASAPSIKFDAWNDLGLEKGHKICLRLKAYNSVGPSDFSQPACADL